MRPVTTQTDRRRRPWLLLPIGLIALVLAACSGNSTALTSTTTTLSHTSTTNPGSTTTTTSPTQRSYVLYFLRGSQLGVSQRVVASASDSHFQAITALVAGINPTESAAGLSTAIPAGTTVRGLEIRNGVATVNLSPQFVTTAPTVQLADRVAQVVYTLTSSPTVTGVIIEVGGTQIVNLGGVNLSSAVGRAQVTGSLPLILLEQPAVGGSMTGKITISGVTAASGTYDVQLLDPTGKLLASVTDTAVSGGTFVQSVPFTITSAETGTVRVFGRPTSTSQPVQEYQFTVPIAP
jgi:hypothetical protein